MRERLMVAPPEATKHSRPETAPTTPRFYMYGRNMMAKGPNTRVEVMPIKVGVLRTLTQPHNIPRWSPKGATPF